MRIPGKPLDAARLAQAQAELVRVEAKLKRDALKADVIARIVSDTAKNKDVLDRPAVFAALTQDPDSMIELARQAGWLAEETHATGAEMRPAGSILGSLLNAFEIPTEQGEPAPPPRSQEDDLWAPHRKEPVVVAPGQATDSFPSPGIVAAPGSPSATATHRLPSPEGLAVEREYGASIQTPLAPLMQPQKAISLALLGIGVLVGIVFFRWLFF